jgi:arginase family enzyme
MNQMLSDQIRILNLDNSLLSQGNFIRRFHPEVFDLKNTGRYCRFWLDQRGENEIKMVLDPDHKNRITLFGSGDFHHVSSLLVEQFQEPVNLIVFDNHPDWDTLPPKTGCGSWVSRALRSVNIKKVILFGVASDDISTLHLESGNLAAMKDNRLEIYPYSHKPARVIFKDVPRNLSIGLRKGWYYNEISWQELENRDMGKFLSSLVGRLISRRVYISIDKDCLTRQYALTNWEEGRFSLGELLFILKFLKKNTDIIGADITGEYSKINIQGMLKSICSSLDHPKEYSAKDIRQEIIDATNEQTNIRIVEALKE